VIGLNTASKEVFRGFQGKENNIGGSYVIVRMNELIGLYRERWKTSKGIRKLTFVVERRDDGYFLVMPHNLPPKPLIHVNNMASVVSALKSLRK